MSVNDLVLVQGMKDTRKTLATWQRDPLVVVGEWLGWSFAIAVILLSVVYMLASSMQPDSTPMELAGGTRPADFGDVAHVLYRNSLVLALHAMACVAGFMAGSSLPLSAEKRSGLS